MLKLHEALALSHPTSYVREATQVSSAANGFIQVNDCDVTLTFQEGASKEHHSEGVLVEDVLQFSLEFIRIMNGHLPCKENEEAIQHIELALGALNKRTADRVARKVEGTSKQ